MRTVKISVGFLDFKSLKVSGQKIKDFETAIKVVRLLNLKNVRLKQNNNGNVMEWDNF